MTESTKRRRGARTVVLEGAVSIAQTADLKERFETLLKRNTKITLDVSAVEKIDTAALQLLLRFVATAREDAIPLVWGEAPSATFESAVAALGMTELMAVEAQ